jgi:hypothetical protein
VPPEQKLTMTKEALTILFVGATGSAGHVTSNGRMEVGLPWAVHQGPGAECSTKASPDGILDQGSWRDSARRSVAPGDVKATIWN